MKGFIMRYKHDDCSKTTCWTIKKKRKTIICRIHVKPNFEKFKRIKILFNCTRDG